MWMQLSVEVTFTPFHYLSEPADKDRREEIQHWCMYANTCSMIPSKKFNSGSEASQRILDTVCLIHKSRNDGKNCITLDQLQLPPADECVVSLVITTPFPLFPVGVVLVEW